MAKRIALKDSVKVDATDLSNFARAVEFSLEHERIDVSGFNATGANEYLAGQTEQSVTVEFFNGYARRRAAHRSCIRSTRTGRPSRSRGGPTRPPPSSATNPELRGNVQLLTYNPSRDPGRGGRLERRVRGGRLRPGSPTSPPRWTGSSSKASRPTRAAGSSTSTPRN